LWTKPTAELDARVEELGSLKDLIQAVGISIAKAVRVGRYLLLTALIFFHQEMCISDLNIEFEELEPTESVDSAQVATASSHKQWLDIKSVDVNVQKNLANLFTSDKALEKKKILKVNEAFQEYYNQGELRKCDQQTDLTRFTRFEISPYSTPAATKPRAIPQLNPGPSSGQTNVVRLGID
jgi:hypothetical protein